VIGCPPIARALGMVRPRGNDYLFCVCVFACEDQALAHVVCLVYRINVGQNWRFRRSILVFVFTGQMNLSQ